MTTLSLRTGLVLVALIFLLAPVSAQPPDAPPGPRVHDGAVVYLDEPAFIPADQQVPALAVFGDDARIDGTVRNALVVIGGRADIAGAVHGDVVVVDGALAVGPEALVTGDVTLYGSTLTREEGAEVVGAVHDEPAVEVSRAAALFWWTSGTLAFLALALAVVSVFGPWPGPVHAGLAAPGRAALVGLGLVLVVPIVAIAAFMSGIGLGVGLLLLAALPGLLVAGYVVGALALGAAVVARLRPSWEGQSWGPYAVAVLGVLALQVAWVVPILGLLVPIASVVGVGALALHAARARRERWEEAEDGRVADPETADAPLALP